MIDMVAYGRSQMKSLSTLTHRRPINAPQGGRIQLSVVVSRCIRGVGHISLALSLSIHGMTSLAHILQPWTTCLLSFNSTIQRSVFYLAILLDIILIFTNINNLSISLWLTQLCPPQTIGSRLDLPHKRTFTPHHIPDASSRDINHPSPDDDVSSEYVTGRTDGRSRQGVSQTRPMYLSSPHTSQWKVTSVHKAVSRPAAKV
jgi:hypothetical protein